MRRVSGFSITDQSQVPRPAVRVYNLRVHKGAPRLSKPPGIIYYPDPGDSLSDLSIPAPIVALGVVAIGLLCLAFPYLILFWIVCEIRMFFDPSLKEKWGVTQAQKSLNEKTNRLHSR